MKIQKLFLSLFGIIILFSGCVQKSNPEMAVYPLSHDVSLYDEYGSEIASLQWGEELIYRGESISNALGQLYLAERSLDKTEGYLYRSDVTHEMIFRAVLLEVGLFYDSPSTSYSTDKVQVFPPLLMYVTETNEDGWAKVLVYLPDEDYLLEDDESEVGDEEWIKLSKISTNEDDVEAVIGAQTALAAFRRALDTDEEEEVLRTQRHYLQYELLDEYSGSDASEFIREVLELISRREYQNRRNPEEDFSDEPYFDDSGEISAPPVRDER